MSAPFDTLKTVLDATFAGLRQGRDTFQAQLTPQEVGTITSVSTAIAMVSGLPGVGYDELVKFPGNVFGIAFNVDETEIGVVLLGDYSRLQAGDKVERTGRVMDVIVGDGLLGRVIDPLGRPLDGLGPVLAGARSPIERQAAPIMDRAPVGVPAAPAAPGGAAPVAPSPGAPAAPGQPAAGPGSQPLPRRHRLQPLAAKRCPAHPAP